MSDPGYEDYEEQILEIVSVLGRGLGVKVRPRRILWHGSSVAAPSFMRGLGSDQCDFDSGDVILPKVLRNRLSPIEWKPLLASQLIYERRSSLTILARWLASILLIIFTWVPAVGFLAADYGDYGLLLAMSLIIPITIFCTWFFSHELRSVRLNADDKAASIVGPQEFLNVLEKMDSFHFKDIERRKKGGFRISVQSHFPAIDARIRCVGKLIEP